MASEMKDHQISELPLEAGSSVRILNPSEINDYRKLGLFSGSGTERAAPSRPRQPVWPLAPYEKEEFENFSQKNILLISYNLNFT